MPAPAPRDSTHGDSSSGAQTESDAAVFTPAAAARAGELQRALELLYREILIPFYEPVERLRVVNNRAIRVQDVVEAVEKESSGCSS